MDKIEEQYELWLSNAADDADLMKELKEMSADSELVYECFYRNLEFGTGGLRGIIGAGSNRMNIYTIRKATQGLADYLLCNHAEPSVAIAYDSRIKSDLFAENAASVLAANGIHVFIYPELMPTPSLSYAVRHLKCNAGICVTASHNPAKYNGYKVYGSDGCQITLEMANSVLAKIEQVNEFNDVNYISFEDGMLQNKIEYISEEVTDSFLNAVKAQALIPVESDLNIVYTPLNGAGRKCVLRILKEIGLNHVTVVPEQEKPDGNFPTCPFPNPEKEEALQKGLELCRKTGADLLLATDPDCDRVGIAVKDKEQNYRLLTGNEVGVLLLDYIAGRRLDNHTMPKQPIVVKTIVTTDMADEVAAEYGIEVINTLTGFKFIGEQIGLLESNNEQERYILGFEESYGYLSGSHVRDKDAVNASMLICEMTSFYLRQGITLVERLTALYEKYGFYQNQLLDFAFEGSKGMSKMNELMMNLRENPLSEIAGHKVIRFVDYQNSEETNLPKSDVLEFRLDDKSKVIIRPSGTEPKIKMYLSGCGKNTEEVKTVISGLEEAVKRLVIE